MKTALWLLAAAFLMALYTVLTLGVDGPQGGLRADAQLGLICAPVVIAALYALGNSERRNAGSFARALCVVTGLGLVGTLGTAIGRVENHPRLFTSAAGRFSVMTPVALDEKIEDLDVGDGPKLKMHSFVGERRGTAYIASYIDYPDHIIDASTPDDMLDGAVQGQSEQPGTRLVSADPIELDEYPGRAVRLEADTEGQQFTLRVRSYMVHNRLYQLITVQKRGTQEAESTKQFLSSFKLTTSARDTRPNRARVAR